jgi:hypothetical protein
MNPITQMNDNRLRYCTVAELEEYATNWFQLHKRFERDLHGTTDTGLWRAAGVPPAVQSAVVWEPVPNYDGLLSVFGILVRESLQSNDARRFGWDQWGYWAITGVTPKQFRHWFDYCVASFDDWVEKTNARLKTKSRRPIQLEDSWVAFDPEDEDIDFEIAF